MNDENQIKTLAAAAARGDREAFGKLYDHLAPRIFNFIVAKVRQKETAEDLLHTVFLKAWSSLPKYKPSGRAKFSTWLFQIANFTVIDYWRTRRETADLDKLENLAQLALSPSFYEEYSYLWRAMDELPEGYRTVLYLRFIQELGIEETAAVMGRTQVGVRVMQHRALKLLRKILKRNGHELV